MEISKRYNTYISGTVGDLVRCTKIILFNKKNTTSVIINGKKVLLPRISLVNLKDLWAKLEADEEKRYIEGNINVDEGAFFFESEDLNSIGGFYDIIYINSLDNSPVGYTDFFRVQGKSTASELKISLNFLSDIKGDLEINIENTVSKYSFTAADFIGEDVWKYTSPKNINSWLESTKKKDLYSTHLSSDKPNYLSNTFVNKGHGYGLKLLNNIDIDPYDVGFKKFKVGYYKSDIVLYSWVGIKYRIISLTTSNNFGNPFEYTISGTGYVKPVGINSDIEISYFSDKYICLTDNSIYDIEKECLLGNLDLDYYYVMDRSGLSQKITKIPITADSTDILNYCPEVSTLSLYCPKYLNQLTEIKGNWYLFRDGDHFILSGLMSAIKIPSDKINNILLINSRTIWVVEYEDDNIVLYIYNSPGQFSIEKSLADDEFVWRKNPDKEIIISTTDEAFSLSKLSEYKRGPIPDSISGLRFIDALDGLVLYTLNNKILRYL